MSPTPRKPSTKGKGKGKGTSPKTSPKAPTQSKMKPGPTPPGREPNRRASRARDASPPRSCTVCGQEIPIKVDARGRRTTFAGQPDKSFRFTPERRKEFLLLIRATTPINVACDSIGCSEDTPRDWEAAGLRAIEARDRGEVLDDRAEEQAAFALEYRQALAKAEVNLIGHVHVGAKRDWKAAAWLAATRWPDRYSEKAAVARIKVNADNPVRDADRKGKELNNEILAERLDAIRDAKKNGGKVLVIGGEDVVMAFAEAEDVPQEIRSAFIDWLNTEGFKFLGARDLGSETPKH